MIIAAIDIGSNAARLLINEVKESKGKVEFTKLNLLRIPLRLGMDVFSKGEIGEERKQMVISTMKIFSQLMAMYKVEHYRACATSAMRDAKNGQEIIDTVREQADINIEIISGDEEATLIYENHVAEGLDKNFAYLYSLFFFYIMYIFWTHLFRIIISFTERWTRPLFQVVT